MTTINEPERTPFAEWVILELMGHRRLAGYLTAEHYARPGQLVTGCWHGCAKFADQEWLTDDDGVDHYIKAGTCVPAEEADDAQ